MANAFGVDDPRVSKGLPSYLRAMKNEQGLKSASPSMRRTLKYADKKGLGGGRKGAMKAAEKHPEGAYMLTRLAAHHQGKAASKYVSMGESSRFGRGTTFASEDIRWGRRLKETSNKIADKHLSKGLPSALRSSLKASEKTGALRGNRYSVARIKAASRGRNEAAETSAGWANGHWKKLGQEARDDSRNLLSKGVTTGLKMAGGNVSRSSAAGGTKKTSDLMRRMAAGKKAGKAIPHGNFSQTQLGRMKEDPFE